MSVMVPRLSKKAELMSKSKSAVREIMDYASPATFKKLGIDPKDVISFGGGWVAHDSPMHLQVAYSNISNDYKEFYKSGGYSPTLGLPECRESIADRQSLYYGIKGLKDSNVAIGASSTQLTYSLLQTLLDKGDTVLTLDPSYCNYPNQVYASADAKIERFPILDTAKWEYDFDEDAFCKRIMESKPKIVLLTSPDNPGSQVVPDEFVESALEAVEEIGSMLVVDFAYKEMVFDERYPKYFSWAPTDNFCSIHSNSKWGRSLGRRLGWIEATESLIAGMDAIIGSSALCGDTMHQMALSEYFNQPIGQYRVYMSRVNDKYEAAARTTTRSISEHLGFKSLCPQGGIYTCMDVGRESSAFVNKMLLEAKVLFIPGWGFGRSTRDAVRLSYGPLVYDLPKIEEGIERVAKVLG